MSGTITITLVNVDGMLVGRTFSDRWNLESLGVGPIPYTRNQSAIKRLRRAHNPVGHVAFIFRFASKGIESLPVVTLSDAESSAIGFKSSTIANPVSAYFANHPVQLDDVNGVYCPSNPYDDNPWYGTFAESHDTIPGLSPSDMQGTYL